MDKQKLMELTNQAIEEGKREKELKENKAKDALLKEEKRLREKAEELICAAPEIARAAATQGLSKVVIMQLNSNEHTNNGYVSGGIQGLAVRLVMEAFKEFNPVLEFWHDGVGVRSGYNLVISWEK